MRYGVSVAKNVPNTGAGDRYGFLLSTGQTDGRTDGWTPDRYIDPALHTMRTAAV